MPKNAFFKLKEELVGKSPDKELINMLIKEPDAGKQFVSEASKTKDNPG
ncbi:MAG: hypothetical protein HWN67_01700, partial [Candidatus Helarchaeota archaeon]|nr:hypothetical protein [Candidatus Helarchaeota archaeon]